MPCSNCGSTIVALIIKQDSAEGRCASCGKLRVDANEKRIVGDLLQSKDMKIFVLDNAKKMEDVHEFLDDVFGGGMK